MYFIQESKPKSTIKRPEDFGINKGEVDKYLRGQSEDVEIEEDIIANREEGLPAYIPQNRRQLLKKSAYYISYNSSLKIAEWVSYPLTKEIIRRSNLKRSGLFERDPEVVGGTASTTDYSGTGYVRGHLVPVADVSYDSSAMNESFLMSNIAPMKPQFNDGIWMELEETIRDWAYAYKEIYVTTGPVLTRGEVVPIGKSKIAAPAYFFKAIWVNDAVRPKSIGFMMPNENERKPLREYVVTINELETITGIDFFPSVAENGVEEEIENQLYISDWRWRN